VLRQQHQARSPSPVSTAVPALLPSWSWLRSFFIANRQPPQPLRRVPRVFASSGSEVVTGRSSDKVSGTGRSAGPRHLVIMVNGLFGSSCEPNTAVAAAASTCS